MSIEAVVKDRDIKEVLHFTTHHGLLGILVSGRLMSKARLPHEKSIEYILRLNTQRDLDPKWKDYVNLSISRINNRLFNISSTKWHTDVWWCVLSFDPVILTHEGVYFVTTNNAYWQHLQRGQGEKALEAMFADSVSGVYGSVQSRTYDMPTCYTTCRQAEVLYPGELSIDFLKRIYVPAEEHLDHIMAMVGGLGCDCAEIVVDPGKFD